MTISQKPRVRVEEEILNDFMRILEENKDSRNPWSKPWTPSSSEGHINFLTGNKYQGMNVIILEMYQFSKGYELPCWIGYQQAKKEFNCVPRKGSKAARIVRPNPIRIDAKDDNGNPILDKEGNPEFYMKMTFKGATVFNIADLVGLDEKSQEKLDQKIANFKTKCVENARPLAERCKAAHDRLIVFKDELEGGLNHGSDSAYYRDDIDSVTMPNREDFKNDEAYLSTLAHEFAHATGHKDRLNRKWLNNYAQYRPQEELVAEFTSVLVANRLQITCDTQNHASYLGGWASRIKDSKNPAQELFKVFAYSSKAANTILGEE